MEDRDNNQYNQVEIVCLGVINAMEDIKSGKEDEGGSPKRKTIKT